MPKMLREKAARGGKGGARSSAAHLAAIVVASAVVAGCAGGSIGSSPVDADGSSGGTTSSGGASSSGASSSGTSSSGTQPTVRVVVAPRAAPLTTGASLQLSASVTGTDPPAVSWTVQEGAAGGTVSSTGLYTAPSAPGIFHVVATSLVDGAARDTATLTVSTPAICTDACAAPRGGVTWDCRKRFMYGLNWAWGEWGADFGGISAWGKKGVKADTARFDADMKRMKAAGVSVIRWWMFPRFLTESIQWGADGAPSGIGGSLLVDLQEALRLADANDVYLMLTPFSFDGFRPTKTESGLTDRGLRPMVVDATLRRKLLENVVRPVAEAVEASPYRRRVIAWDLINEPEWALSGADAYGDPAFEPTSGMETVTHAQLETFLNELAAVLRARSGALLTVGSAAIKWPKAWSRVDIDFYQLHYYDWVYEWFPYATVTPASVGLTDRPVVMGEFPAAGLSSVKGRPARTAPEFADDLWDLGYAGALSWALNDTTFPWSDACTRPFHDQHACETAF